MRIISPFHDYYDGVMAEGQDRSLVYDRRSEIMRDEEKLIELHEGRKLTYVTSGRFMQSGPDKGILFLAGKMYPYYVGQNDQLRGMDQFKDIMSFEGDKFESLLRPAPIHDRQWRRRNSNWDHKKYLAENWGRETSVNVDMQCPVVLLRPSKIGEGANYGRILLEKNPVLMSQGWQRVFDPYMIFQEISMFLGGVLTRNMDPVVQMTDKDKVRSHGMDPVYGFRKMPGR